MNHYRNYSENQLLFDTNIHGLRLFTKWILITLVRLPLIITGYLVAKYVLVRTNNFWMHLVFTIGFAYIAYLLVYFLKGFIISLKSKQSFWWVPVFTIIVFFVCVLPMLMLLQADFGLIRFIRNIRYAPAIIVSIYSIYTYNNYRFLTNVAPRPVYAVYNAGIVVAEKLIAIKAPRVLTRILFGK